MGKPHISMQTVSANSPQLSPGGSALLRTFDLDWLLKRNALDAAYNLGFSLSRYAVQVCKAEKYLMHDVPQNWASAQVRVHVSSLALLPPIGLPAEGDRVVWGRVLINPMNIIQFNDDNFNFIIRRQG